MNAKELKTYLLEDNERIETLLENYGFSMFWQSGDDLRCAPPQSDNKTACSIKLNEELYASLYTMKGFHGDIYGLLEEVSGESFTTVIKTIKAMFGITSKGSFQKKADLFSNVNKYLKKNDKRDEYENQKYDSTILNRFIKLPHQSFIKEGIAPDVLSMFDICYDPVKDRVVIPHFDWEEHDKIVGLAGRSTLSAEECKLLDIPKYWHYKRGFMKTHNFFGWNQATKYVNEEKMLVIFEAEKSVLKQVTRSEDRRCISVSVGGHTLSDSQLDFIIANTDPDTEIVIAFDKDVMMMKDDDGQEIGEEFIREICSNILPYRKTSYVWDGFGLLNEHDSPIDKSLKEWNVLLKYRKKMEEDRWQK